MRYFKSKYEIDIKLLFKKDPSFEEKVKKNIFKNLIDNIQKDKKTSYPKIKPRIENQVSAKAIE